MTTQWPQWVCKNSCGAGPFPEDTKHIKCPGLPGKDGKRGPGCGAPLIRWREYEERR